jgi:hypothetical protein
MIIPFLCYTNDVCALAFFKRWASEEPLNHTFIATILSYSPSSRIFEVLVHTTGPVTSPEQTFFLLGLMNTQVRMPVMQFGMPEALLFVIVGLYISVLPSKRKFQPNRLMLLWTMFFWNCTHLVHVRFVRNRIRGMLASGLSI